MKKKNFFIIFFWLSAAVCAFFFTAQVSAQDHSGHTAQSPASNKSKTTSPQATPPVETTQDVPQIEISPEQQKLIGVKTVKVDIRPLQKTIRTVGRLEAEQSKLATVNTKIEGWIEKLYVEATGSYIKKGQPLVDIYSPWLPHRVFLSIPQSSY